MNHRGTETQSGGLGVASMLVVLAEHNGTAKAQRTQRRREASHLRVGEAGFEAPRLTWQRDHGFSSERGISGDQISQASRAGTFNATFPPVGRKEAVLEGDEAGGALCASVSLW